MKTPNSDFLTERMDDLPLLLALLQKLDLAAILDRHLNPHGNRKGLSYGWLCVIWLAHILSRGDHRMNHVRESVAQAIHTFAGSVPVSIQELDFTDDRLADLLHALSDEETWEAIETELNAHTLKVYELTTETVRLDTTTVTVDTEPKGMLRLGHSKDHRPDMPQVKMMLASLDPLAMPLVTQVVAGNCADDPLYLPAVEQVRTSVNKRGLLYVGDSKMASAKTRHGIAVGGDFYLTPLSAVGMPLAQLKTHWEPVLTEQQPLVAVYRLDPKGERQLIAEGFEWSEIQEHDGFCWEERRLLMRSLSHQQSASHALDRRLGEACNALRKLGERGKGKCSPSTPEAFESAIEKTLTGHRVQGLITYALTIATSERTIRAYKGQPERLETTYQMALTCQIDLEAVEKEKAFLGCRVFVTNTPITRLSLSEAVLAYRDEYRIESNFARLKGQSLSVSPMYLQRQDHMQGLMCLLSIGLRVLTLLEYVVRKALAQTGTSLSGLYAGNAKRSTTQPTAELLLEAFQNITLLLLPQNGHYIRYLNALTGLQQKILELSGCSAGLYVRLTTQFGISPEK